MAAVLQWCQENITGTANKKEDRTMNTVNGIFETVASLTMAAIAVVVMAVII